MAALQVCGKGHEWHVGGDHVAASDASTCPVCGSLALPSTLLQEGMQRAAHATTVIPAAVSSIAPDATLTDAASDADPLRLMHADTATATEQPRIPSTDSQIRSAPPVPGYELLAVLGRGGMGVVYKARHKQLNRIVALKMILAGAHASERQRARFHLEAEAVASLQHPNIVQVYEVGEHESCPFFSLEYVDGGGLDQRIQGKPQPPKDSASLVETLARAMHVAHQRGIIHRDLKPSNVLLTASGTPKIADFGLAKRFEESPDTHTGAVLGTPGYMAPEQAGGKPTDVGPAADVYALGSILYEMLCGHPPFQGATALAILQQVHFSEAPALTKLQEGIPRDLETICLKCLEKDRHKRYSSAEALAEDLRRFRQNEPISARPVGRVERTWKWVRRQPALAALVATGLVFCAALVVGSLWYAQHSRHVLETERSLRQQADAASKQATEQSALARRNLRRAQDAVNRLLRDVGEKDIAYEPNMEAKRRELLERAVRFHRDFLADNGDLPELRYDAGVANRGLADVHRLLGDYDAAQVAYVEALAQLQRAYADEPTDDRRLALAETYFNYGWLLSRDRCQPEEGRQAYVAALELWERKDPDQEVQQWLARTQNELGLLAAEAEDVKAARSAYAKALHVQQDLAQQHPERDDYLEHLAGTHNDVGRVLRDNAQDLDVAEANFKTAIDIFRKLKAKDDRRSEYTYKLAAGLNNLGMLLIQRKPTLAEEWLAEAELLLTGLMDDFRRVPLYRQELAKTYRAKGMLAYERKRRDEALEWWRRELGVLTGLKQAFQERDQARQNAELQYELGWSHGNVGMLHSLQAADPATADVAKREHLEHACRYFELAVTHLKQAQVAGPKQRYQRACFKQLMNLADARLGIKDVPAALVVARELVALHPYNADAFHFAACYAARASELQEFSADAAANRLQALNWLEQAVTLKADILLDLKNLNGLNQEPRYQSLRQKQQTTTNR